ncbi:MAG TPA: Arc family DNA-binding protein [Pseudomonadales bacterium]
MTKESSESINQFEAMSSQSSSQPGDAQPHDQLREDDSKSPAMIEKFVIRLPNGLRDRIRQLSEQNRRSMNSEIIMVLESHIRQQFMQQMAEANPDGGDFAPGQRKTEAELNKMLESLPAQKKEALLELLG